jgi:hypothetical protein
MEARGSGNVLGWALAVAGVAGLLVGVALLTDIGPFAEEELSREELIARGDQICVEAHEAFVDLQRKLPQTAREAAELTERLASIAEDESRALAKLDGPAELEAQIETYLDARERGIEALRRGADAADADESDAYERAQAELADGQRERRRIAREIGFGECSRPID